MKVAVVYWSGTGNTEKMADCIAEGIENAGSEVEVIFCDDFGADMLNDYDLVAFGCPAMGDEVLEESSFEPMFEAVEEELNGRKIALFGSYEWNEGQKWMKDWKVRCEGVGAKIVAEPLCVYDCPTPEDEDDCVAFGEKIAKA